MYRAAYPKMVVLEELRGAGMAPLSAIIITPTAHKEIARLRFRFTSACLAVLRTAP